MINWQKYVPQYLNISVISSAGIGLVTIENGTSLVDFILEFIKYPITYHIEARIIAVGSLGVQEFLYILVYFSSPQLYICNIICLLEIKLYQWKF